MNVMRNFYCYLLSLFFTFTACAQTMEHARNEQWIKDTKNAELHTVLLNNQSSSIPLKDLQTSKIASINMGSYQAAAFDSIAGKYTAITGFSVGAPFTNNANFNSLGESLKFYNTLIIQVTAGFLNDVRTLPFILENQKNKHVILVLYGDPQALTKLDSVTAPIILCPVNTPAAAQFAAQVIFGGVAATAKLDRAVSLNYKQGDGYITSVTRLNYAVPEAVGIDIGDLQKPIDAVMAEAISQRATPGAVVLVAKDGKVIFNKSYGYHTYANADPDQITDIFDLASVTKVSATTMAVMKLYEEQKLKLDTNVGAYIQEARNTNKNNIQVRDLMLHQAGLVSYIPFYQNIRPGDFSRDSSEIFSVKVADNYYLRRGYYEEIMWPQMLRSHLETPGKYVYSDLSMYFMKEIVERRSMQPLSKYVQENFYQPLGMQTAGYNPRYRFARERIVPTEDDTYFRMTLLQGFVHDQGAAMAGGVSGHAGMFASANDLAILFQMMLNKGTYGGMQYFKPETVEMFTSRQSKVSRRGLGFDRWDPETRRKYPSELASPQTYGHTGFTGTCVWVDPKYNLIYVFLSNRVHGTAANKLASMDIRSRIQDAIYSAILRSQQ